MTAILLAGTHTAKSYHVPISYLAHLENLKWESMGNMQNVVNGRPQLIITTFSFAKRKKRGKKEEGRSGSDSASAGVVTDRGRR